MEKREEAIHNLPEGFRIEHIFEPVAIPIPETLTSIFPGVQSPEWMNEIYTVTAYKGKLYISPNRRGIWEFDGKRCRQVMGDPVREPIEAIVIFKGNLIIGNGDAGLTKVKEPYPSNPFIVKFDGKEWKIIRLPGTEGRFHIGGFGIYQDELYAGVAGQIWKSKDGENWVLDYETGRDHHLICAFFTAGDNIYAGEGNLEEPHYIYRKSSGKWSIWKTLENIMVIWGGSDRITYGDWAFVSTVGTKQAKAPTPGQGFVPGSPGAAPGNALMICNENKTLRFLELPGSWLGKGSYSYHSLFGHRCLIASKFIEGKMYIYSGTGSEGFGHGELWVWDGLKLEKLLELPFGIGGVELFKGRIYLGGNTVSLGQQTGQEADIRRYSGSYGFLVSAPLDILSKYAHQPSQVKRIWDNIPIPANSSIISNDDGGILIPALGYRRKTFYITDSQKGTLTIEADPDGTGAYEIFLVKSLEPGESKRIYTEEGACFFRVRIKQGSEDGVVKGRVLLE